MPTWISAFRWTLNLTNVDGEESAIEDIEHTDVINLPICNSKRVKFWDRSRNCHYLKSETWKDKISTQLSTFFDERFFIPTLKPKNSDDVKIHIFKIKIVK